MNNETSEIIEIGTDQNESAMIALIDRRQSYRSIDLATMPAGGIDAAMRELYFEAQRRGIIVVIGLAIRELGIRDDKGDYVYEDVGPGGHRLIARIEFITGFISVVVGTVIAVRNDTPGHERLIPGEWMQRLYSQQKARAAQLEWEKTSMANRRRAEQIGDFKANI